jgi:transcriptional regulator with XRE-family HTH domain
VKPARRFDPAPLLAFALQRSLATFAPQHDLAQPDSNARLAEVLGAHPTQVSRWRNGGTVPWLTADRMATNLGVHPSAIWPEWTAEREAS